MDYTLMRKRAGRITKQRSLKPDMQYILYAAVLSLTIVGIPAAYSIVKEYNSYLIKCRNSYDPENDGKKIVYEHRSPTQVLSGYSLKTLSAMLKVMVFVLLPGSAFVKSDRLTGFQNLQIKANLSVMKSMFFDIYISEASIIALIILAFVLELKYLPFIILGIAALIVIEFRPFVTYCQALIMFRKVCEETEPDHPETYI